MTLLFSHPGPAAANATTKDDIDGANEPPARRTRKPMSEETKLKISQAMKNRPPRPIGDFNNNTQIPYLSSTKLP